MYIFLVTFDVYMHCNIVKTTTAIAEVNGVSTCAYLDNTVLSCVDCVYGSDIVLDLLDARCAPRQNSVGILASSAASTRHIAKADAN